MTQGQGGGRPRLDRSKVVTTFRMDAELNEQLQAAAQASGRTLSGEIAYRLQASFSFPMTPSPERGFMLAVGEALRHQYPQIEEAFRALVGDVDGDPDPDDDMMVSVSAEVVGTRGKDGRWYVRGEDGRWVVAPEQPEAKPKRPPRRSK